MIRKIRLLIALAGLCGAYACKTTAPTSPIATAGVVIAADCGAPALRDLAAHLLDDVTSALLSGGDFRAALAAVAGRAGADGAAAVKCAVTELLGKADLQLSARARMEPDAVNRTEMLRDRATTWLAEHPDR